MNPEIITILKMVELDHFRTNEDTGAHPCAMIVMNSIRRIVGLPYINKDDLPSWSIEKKGYYMPVGSKLLCAPDILVRGGKV